MLQKGRDMSNGKTRVPPEFVEHFNAVAVYYECTPEEITEMKQCAREHLDEAIPCFAAIAKEIS